MSKPDRYLFGIHADPPRLLALLYQIAPFLALIVVYHFTSSTYLAANPDGKVFPSFTTMFQSMKEMAFVRDPGTGTFTLWADTFSSLFRFGGGILLAAVTGLFVGLNMALFPGMRLVALPFVTALSIIPTLAVLPILLIVFGIGDMAKVSLIFLGLTFFIARDIYTMTREIPQELLVKAQTLGASELALVYRIVLPLTMPRLIEAVRQSLGPAWLFLIASEGIASTQGLGYRIFLQRRYLDMATIIPYVVWITVLAFAIDRCLALALRYLYPWKQ